ncbi:MAG: hydrogenase nickel incorporation protein HypB [Nitrospirae bacterium]|nr:hydrogenase nickel incorporation protein HypB [Nitrospirota bacterium]
MNIKVVTKILDANDRIAGTNRRKLKAAGIYTINLMGAPGAGKTSLLECVIGRLKGSLRIGVIEGDIAGTDDARRIALHNVPVVQINTGGACHLDANMIGEVLDSLPLGEIDVLIVENVGNLVCPAEFSIGEDMKIMVSGITEGHDKPGKYPLMFRQSSALILNKTDLLPYVDIDMERFRADTLSLNPQIKIFEVSCKTQVGIGEFCDWLRLLR